MGQPASPTSFAFFGRFTSRTHPKDGVVDHFKNLFHRELELDKVNPISAL